MKKTLTNADIETMYNVLNELKGRADIIPGDSNIFWANSLNLQELREKVTKIQEIKNDMVNSYFTDKTSHTVKSEDGKESRVLNDDVKDEILAKIQSDVTNINNKTMELELEPIPKESLKDMFKANEKSMSMIEMTVMAMFVDNTEKKDKDSDTK